jgi:hypothetical protein
MSSTTYFKRIALVAAAALGIGVLSAIPSSATVSDLTVTVAAGTSTIQTGTTGGTSDTRTAALITVTGLLDNAGDSITVQAAAKSVPTNASRVALLDFYDTLTTAGYIKTVVETHTAVETVTALTHAGVSVAESKTVATALYNASGALGATGYVGARFFLQLESGTGTTKAGTYTYAVTVKSFDGQSRTWTSTVKDVSITVAALASASTVADPFYSKLYISTAENAAADVAVNAVPVEELPETRADTFSVDAVVVAAVTGLIPNWNNGLAAAVAVDASPVFPEPDATASLPGLAV